MTMPDRFMASGFCVRNLQKQVQAPLRHRKSSQVKRHALEAARGTCKLIKQHNLCAGLTNVFVQALQKILRARATVWCKYPEAVEGNMDNKSELEQQSRILQNGPQPPATISNSTQTE